MTKSWKLNAQRMEEKMDLVHYKEVNEDLATSAYQETSENELGPLTYQLLHHENYG